MTEPFAGLFGFVHALRASGLSPGTDRVANAARALVALPARPYWAMRLTLCASPSDLRIFDHVWNEQAAGTTTADDGAEVAAVAEPGTSDWNKLATTLDRGRGGAITGDDLSRRDLADLTAAELDEIRRLIALLSPIARRRPVMRRDRTRSGRVDPVRTVRLMLRHDGEPSRIPRTRRARRPRRLLLLIDISASMLEYRDAYLRFAHAAAAAGPTTTEVFSIGTKCTRLTPLLKGRNAGDAMRALADLESDWNRGTTLGRSLSQLLHGWGGRACVRGAVIVIFSDGEEGDARQLLPRKVARLSRLGHRLIWVNPLLATPNYEPFGALEKSLGYAHNHLPGHDFASLRNLAEVIAR